MKFTRTPLLRSLVRYSALPLAVAAVLAPAHAADKEKFTLITNWYAQAEHGGFYQALATGLYAQYGLDVTIKMGGPQVNQVQMMAAGQADCVMGASDLQMLQIRASGVPVKTVAAFMQKDPQVLITHPDVKGFADLKDKTVLIAPNAHQSYWPWLKAQYGLTDAQSRPYTWNIQPFMLDKNTSQQGYLTSEPYAIEQAGGKANVLLFSDHGYPAYAATITCMDDTLNKRRGAVKSFLHASAEGWKSYLANPAPANVLIRKDNPKMTEEQLAYGVRKLNEAQIISGGDAGKLGIGALTTERARKSYDFLVKAGLLNASKVTVEQAYDVTLMDRITVLP